MVAFAVRIQTRIFSEWYGKSIYSCGLGSSTNLGDEFDNYSDFCFKTDN